MGVEQGSRPEAESVHNAGAEVVHDDVHFCHQAVDDVESFWAGEIQLQSSLVQVQLVEVGGPVEAAIVGEKAPARRIRSASGLDLDHLGAEEAEQQRGVRPRCCPCEVEDTDALEHPSAVAVDRQTLGPG